MTVHHIVPYVFRKNFPNTIKRYNNHDSLLLCIPCHKKYELASLELHKKICDEFGVSQYVEKEISDLHYAVRLASALLKNGDKIPAATQKDIKNRIKKRIGDHSIESLANMKNHIGRSHTGKSYGLDVVSNSNMNIQEFTIRWRKHFVEFMNPQFLPELWDINAKL